MLPYFEQPVWQIGPLSIHAFGATVALATSVGLALAGKRFARLGLDPVLGQRLGAWMLIGGILGAHLSPGHQPRDAGSAGLRAGSVRRRGAAASGERRHVGLSRPGALRAAVPHARDRPTVRRLEPPPSAGGILPDRVRGALLPRALLPRHAARGGRAVPRAHARAVGGRADRSRAAVRRRASSQAAPRAQWCRGPRRRLGVHGRWSVTRRRVCSGGAPAPT